MALVHELNDRAEAASQRFVELLRRPDWQPWLGLGGETPVGIGNSELVDLDANQTLAVVLTLNGGSGRHTSDDRALDQNSLESALVTLRRGDRPSLADTLLADALYYALSAEPRDPTRAVLTAAVASEVNVKQTLRDCADPRAADVLQLLLESPRDWSMQAASLFDKAAKAIAGRSLREDDKALFQKVTRLFEVRNRIAHRGISPAPKDAWDGVHAAAAAFKWLESLRNDPALPRRAGPPTA